MSCSKLTFDIYCPTIFFFHKVHSYVKWHWGTEYSQHPVIQISAIMIKLHSMLYVFSL